jgi:hypothetical protein
MPHKEKNRIKTIFRHLAATGKSIKHINLETTGKAVLHPEWDVQEESPSKPSKSSDWSTSLREAIDSFAEIAAEKHQILVRIVSFEKRISELGIQVEKLRESRAQEVHIATFAPDPFVALREIPVLLEPTDDGYIATFFDAEISTVGVTQEQAFSNLKSLLVDMFESLEEDEAILGPGPAKQLAALKSVMQRRK